MKHLSTNQIRDLWLEFFSQHDHYVETSKSLIPVNDNSLLFINSGVATLKRYFDGSEKPPKNRITNAQKSIRTNDIENVGVTSRHHTLFEMLGNFSIGDYFKEEAIDMMFEIIFDEKWFAFDLQDFYFTIHPDDNEAYQCLIKHGVSEERIVKLEENFWEIGEGPGGPNLEIFYDRGSKYDERDPYLLLSEDLENDRVIEVWNIVFSQYNCQPGVVARSEYQELPQKNIDTGMGLERMACIMQEVDTNFETDNFMEIIKVVEQMSNHDYQSDKMPFRVIADHIRALTFAISDGVLPANEGRGYVIRRILRRASKYGYQNLGLKEPFLYQLVDVVVKVSQPYYDYLLQEQAYVKEVIKNEEEKFLNTLASGINMFNQALNNNLDKVDGELAFKLYDTYGFPIELTQELAQEHNLDVDLEGFKQALKAQQERARNAIKDTDAMHAQNAYLKTIDVASEFVGYNELAVNTTISFITDLHQPLESVDQGTAYVILNKTPFYALSGGQVSDKGTIAGNEVVSVIKLPNGQHLMEVVIDNPLRVGQEVEAIVDQDFRLATSQNHSVTHLLHYALQQTLGANAKQAGSYQDNLRTRFDFSHMHPVTDEQLQTIENIVNEIIDHQHDVVINQMPIAEAQALGAMSLFGEKYGDIVRVVKMGDSIELCGGTHVNNTSDIKYFYIVSESGIGSGVRRIEAITADRLFEQLDKLKNEWNDAVKQINDKISNQQLPKIDNLTNIANKIKHILTIIGQDASQVDDEYAIIDKSIKEAKIKLEQNNDQVLEDAYNQCLANINHDPINYVDIMLDNINPKILRTLADRLINNGDVNICILRANNDNQVSVVVKVRDENTNQYQANDILNQILVTKEGRGGGKANMAQGAYTLS